MLEPDKIKELQASYGVAPTQKLITSGEIWKAEGGMGRFAMTLLEAGVCFLGVAPTTDYYGNTVPSRNNLKAGTKGTLENAQQFWQKVWDGDFHSIEILEDMFGYEIEDEVP